MLLNSQVCLRKITAKCEKSVTLSQIKVSELQVPEISGYLHLDLPAISIGPILRPHLCITKTSEKICDCRLKDTILCPYHSKLCYFRSSISIEHRYYSFVST